MHSCTYCNSTLDITRDHVIPRSWSNNQSFATRYCVPACKECNVVLGNTAVHTVKDRAAYLYNAFLKRYKKEINFVDWTETELSTVSSDTRTTVQSKMQLKNIIMQRIENIRIAAEQAVRIPSSPTFKQVVKVEYLPVFDRTTPARVIDIHLHLICNGMTVTLETDDRTYEYAFKNKETAFRQIKHLVEEIENSTAAK